MGPLISLLNVNDIQTAVPNVSTRFFADKNCADLVKKASLTLGKPKDWFDAKKVNFTHWQN